MTTIRIIVKHCLHSSHINMNTKTNHLIKELNNAPLQNVGFIKSCSYREFSKKDTPAIYTIYDWESYKSWKDWTKSSTIKQIKCRYSDIIKSENIHLLYKDKEEDIFLL